MSERITVGEAIVRLLEGADAGCAFGVISIHNMPILDAIAQRRTLRFVPARGEAGATSMADAYARVRGGLGIVVTSTGTGAGNAAGAMVEAQTAGTPVLHLTGQIESPYLDRHAGYVHEAADQLGMLRALSKAAFRVRSAATALGTVREALRIALTPPRGPVSVEIPIDFQKTLVDANDPSAFAAPLVDPVRTDAAALEAAAETLSRARRPALWLGGGARGASKAARRFAQLGWAVVTSVAGRGIVPEDDPASLGSFGAAPPVEALFERCDAMLVAGSRLRGNETLRYTVALPRPRILIDADELARERAYVFDGFVRADVAVALDALADRLQAGPPVDPGFAAEIRAARTQAEERLRGALGPFAGFVTAVERRFGPEAIWVRDVTISNSMWGNRLPALLHPRQGVHAVGGGIGQGLPMAIGAAVAQPRGPVFALCGDGGLALSLGELGTLAQERLPVVAIVMNDRGYGVIRNIQDAEYGGRRCFVDLATPDFAALAAAYGVEGIRVASVAAFEEALARAAGAGRPVLLDVDMAAFGAYAHAFAGPPVRLRQ